VLLDIGLYEEFSLEHGVSQIKQTFFKVC